VKKYVFLTLTGCLWLGISRAQNFQALHGSPYSGSLSNDFNPAAILNSPYAWDLTLFGVESKSVTNAFNYTNVSLLHIPDTLLVNTRNGNFSRYLLWSADLHLFNARISLNRRSAIAFGANIRTYARVKTQTYNYTDSTFNLTDFLSINQPNSPLGANMVQSSWLEAYGTYSRVIYEDDGSRLQAGITLSLSRSLAGAYAYADNASFVPYESNYQVTNISAQYGYSSNWDNFKKGESFTEKIKRSLKEGQMGGSFSIGGEYVQKTGEDYDREAKGSTDEYDWKLGVAVLDVGVNRYLYGNGSAVISGVKGLVTDTMLNRAMMNINSIQKFNDTIKNYVQEFYALRGHYNISNPARLMVNFDKKLDGYWAVNGELSINFTGINSSYTTVQELNLITVTPRWEKSNLGAYMPVEVTNQGHFWVGGAVKLGPVLFGLHNLGWLVSKKSVPNGGGYLAVIIHPGKFEGDGVPCPKFKY
jgi:hypothetical protein